MSGMNLFLLFQAGKDRCIKKNCIYRDSKLECTDVRTGVRFWESPTCSSNISGASIRCSNYLSSCSSEVNGLQMWMINQWGYIRSKICTTDPQQLYRHWLIIHITAVTAKICYFPYCITTCAAQWYEGLRQQLKSLASCAKAKTIWKMKWRKTILYCTILLPQSELEESSWRSLQVASICPNMFDK